MNASFTKSESRVSRVQFAQRPLPERLQLPGKWRKDRKFCLWKAVNSGEITVSSPSHRNSFTAVRLVLRARGDPQNAAVQFLRHGPDKLRQRRGKLSADRR